MERLRAATRELHESLESLPYTRALLDGSLPLSHYQSFLRALHIIHLALEQAVELASHEALKQLAGRASARRLRLERDLGDLHVDAHAVDAPGLRALLVAQRMRLDALREPSRLLGYLYVLEGSQLGGLVQHAVLARRSELQRGGLAYLQGDGKRARQEFEAFTVELERVLADQAALESAVRGAQAAFEGFAALLGALDPSQPPAAARTLVQQLNDEAGTHPIPDDMRELEAALAAGERSHRTWVYYEARYGERGRRFTRSDSAWLATLSRHEAALTLRHVRWLAGVLAARGMPTLLLEQHLELLCDALSASLPDHAVSYLPLRQAAAELRRARTDAIPGTRASALVEAFCLGRQAEHGISPEEAGRLLVAAAADQRAGLPGSPTSLADWLANPVRFSKGWVAAARGILLEAAAGSAQTAPQDRGGAP